MFILVRQTNCSLFVFYFAYYFFFFLMSLCVSPVHAFSPLKTHVNCQKMSIFAHNIPVKKKQV